MSSKVISIKPPKEKIKQSTIWNTQIYNYYYNWLASIVLNIFKWDGFIDNMDSRYLELSLMTKGIAIGFKDEIVGMLALPVNLSGMFDVVGIPVNYNAYGANGYTNSMLDKKNSVLCFNNNLFQNSTHIIDVFAYDLYCLHRTQMVNVNAQKTPVVVVANGEQQKNTMLSALDSYDGNEPYIMIDSSTGTSLRNEQIYALKTDAPFVADKLETLMHNKINDFLSRFGIENSNNDKKERLNESEVNSNYGMLESSRNIYLTTRKKWAKEMNDMFGLNITVDFNSDVDTLINQGFSNSTESEGDDE